jgi:hypothetical protein
MGIKDTRKLHLEVIDVDGEVIAAHSFMLSDLGDNANSQIPLRLRATIVRNEYIPTAMLQLPCWLLER